MELAIALIVHLILSISTNVSAMLRSFYGVHPFEQEQLLAHEWELHGIQENYDRLMFLKRELNSVPLSIPNGAYLEEMEATMHQTEAVLNNYIVTHQAQEYFSKVRIVRDMVYELRILKNLIRRWTNELRNTRQGLSQQQQLEENLRATSQQQESERSANSTELSDVVNVIMPGFDRPTHFGFRRSASETQKRNGGRS